MILPLTKTSSVSASPLTLFHETEHPVLIDRPAAESLLREVEKRESCTFAFVEAVFVDEEKITAINREYLDRDYVTDIITFRYDEEESAQQIEGTMFCCAPRIAEQAAELGEEPAMEFRRVYVHGLLHLAGYEDDTPEHRAEMKKREDFYLETGD